jgi:ribosomal-protein-serine acetyltransferase
MFKHIIEPGLELRVHNERHAEEMYAVVDANREHLGRFMPWVEKTNSVEDIKNYIRRTLQGHTDNKELQAAIWLDGKYIGGIGFHTINWHRRFGEIGYWLAADAQGRGIMTKCVRAFVDHAFGELKLNRVEIRCDPENARSRAIPKKLGFVEEATLRQVLNGPQDSLHDAVIYGQLRSEWEAQHK